MLDKKSFAQIRKSFEIFEEKREETIQNSRGIIQLSKKIIYDIHRNDLKSASIGIKKIKLSLKKISTQKYDTGIDSVAQQEYVEAIVFYEFVKNEKIPTHTQLKVSAHNYLMGLCDLTGELGRHCVNQAIKRDYKEVFRTKDLVDEIYGEFLKFNLRNSDLRKKSDAIKWNLKKIEDLVYSIKTKSTNYQ
ncbi:hypothetical protein J4459_03490 [Candidatus Woesearchaeota archaeon]|nr:hypothetical protein [Candidatus Woesearchaeota archaeon]